MATRTAAAETTMATRTAEAIARTKATGAVTTTTRTTRTPTTSTTENARTHKTTFTSFQIISGHFNSCYASSHRCRWIHHWSTTCPTPATNQESPDPSSRKTDKSGCWKWRWQCGCCCCCVGETKGEED